MMLEVSVAGKVSIYDFKFIEGRKTRDEMVKFRGVGIVDEEIVDYKDEDGGVWWRKSMSVEVSEKPCWDRKAKRRSWDKSPDWGRPGIVFKASE